MENNIQISNVNLCYEIFGENNTENIILISGLGSQMIRWDDSFCNLMSDRGFRVVRFDNRDSGCSVLNSTDDFNFNDNIQDLFSKFKAEDIPYSLMDMATDVIGLLNYLHIKEAHFIGRSMGGIIAQLLGSFFPKRVLSLTIIMSTSLNPKLPPSKPEVMTMMMKSPVDPNIDKEGFINEKLIFAEKISGNKYKLDKNIEVKMIEAELSRSKTRIGIFRQLLAMGAFRYDSEILRNIKTPVLVIHGTEDPIFHLDCGKDIAGSISNSKFVLIEGMGHSIPVELFEFILDHIFELIKQKNITEK